MQTDTGLKALLFYPGTGLELLHRRTAMDALALFEHTLLHEMTHAIKGDGDAVATEDIGGNNGYGKCSRNFIVHVIPRMLILLTQAGKI